MYMKEPQQRWFIYMWVYSQSQGQALGTWLNVSAAPWLTAVRMFDLKGRSIIISS